MAKVNLTTKQMALIIQSLEESLPVDLPRAENWKYGDMADRIINKFRLVDSNVDKTGIDITDIK